jgi:hypothetical protein
MSVLQEWDTNFHFHYPTLFSILAIAPLQLDNSLVLAPARIRT